MHDLRHCPCEASATFSVPIILQNSYKAPPKFLGHLRLRELRRQPFQNVPQKAPQSPALKTRQLPALRAEVIGQSVGFDASPLSCFLFRPRKSRERRRKCSHTNVSNTLVTRSSTPPAQTPQRSLSCVKVGTHSALGERSHTAAHTAKHGAFRMGALLLPSERFTRFGNPAWPGVRTANFAAFGSWSEALLKDTESLRNSDALMRVAVPRRRGPAGLRDLFRFCRNCGLYALRSGPFRVCEARGGITTLSALYVLLKRRTAACQNGSFAVF